MADYIKTTDFAAKDALTSGDPNKVVKGTEIDDEFQDIETAVATKVDNTGDTITGTLNFTDGVKATFGTGGDLEVTHNATDNVINSVGTADLLLQKAGTTVAEVDSSGVTVTGNITVTGTVDGRDVATDGTKLDTVETNADVTDTTNVTTAGALMDSELTDIASVKALDQGVATTDSPTFAGITTTADINFGDNDKAIFGAGSDLQIYHDGADSWIKDAGAGDLIISGINVVISDGSGSKYFEAKNNDQTVIYANGTQKLATTSTGVDVTGTVTADGLTVDGDVAFTDGASTTKFFWDASAESLGIGTSSPSAPLEVSGTYGVAQLTGTTGWSGLSVDKTNGGIIYGLDDGTTFGNADGTAIIRNTVGKDLVYLNGTSERMRIDSSGNLLVGKTSTGSNTVGVEASANGQIVGTSSGANPLLLNRQSSDGDISRFYKDSTLVGSIGNDSNNLFINFSQANNVGVAAGTSGGNPVLFPTGNTGTVRDNAVSLGYSTGRFKDLYLSGGVYLGGTGSDNLLDDYEIGSWTPTIDSAVNLSGTPSIDKAIYTKVGDLVTIQVSITGYSITSATTQTYFRTTLPFGTDTNNPAAVGSARTTNATATGFVANWTGSNNTQMLVNFNSDCVNSSGSVTIEYTLTYRTA
jgi:hypothetical protein